MRAPATRKTNTGRNTRILRGANGGRTKARSPEAVASAGATASASTASANTVAASTASATAVARRRVAGALSAMAILGSVALAGCTGEDPAMPDPAAQTAPVVIGADGGDDQQRVLAEVYSGALESRGRESEIVDVPAAERVDAVRTGHVGMAFGCTGELLGLLAPGVARQLADEYEADDDPGKATSAEWRDRVYVAMSEALPGEVMATDPSNAQGCGAEAELAGQPGGDDTADTSSSGGDGAAANAGSDGGGGAENAGRPQPGVGAGGAGSLGPGGSGGDSGSGGGSGSGLADVGANDISGEATPNPGAALPQHIVPFYLKPTLTRHERVNALNRVAGSLTTDEVAALTEDTRRTREPRTVAQEWLATSRFATG